MKIGFAWGFGGPKNWGDYSLEEGLGGSETMMILYARAFARWGHEVYCHAPCTPGLYNGVHWLHYDDPMPELDWAIVIRDVELMRRYENAKVRAYLANDPWAINLPQAVGSGLINRVICISRFQQQHLAQQFPSIPEDAWMVSSAGVSTMAFREPCLQNPYACLYSSTPERGLAHLLRLWPQIVAQEAQAQLFVTSGFQLYGYSDEQAKEMSDNLYEKLAALPNVHVSPHPYTRSEYIRIVKGCSIMAYPCTYDEMCCIAALEAQAAGVVVVSTKRGAMMERVPCPGYGILLEGTPGQGDYDQDFVGAVVGLMRDPIRRERIADRSYSLAWKNDYTNLVAQWEEELRGR
jgi:glycosyltransferase involved in cell wall biosynthesis